MASGKKQGKQKDGKGGATAGSDQAGSGVDVKAADGAAKEGGADVMNVPEASSVDIRIAMIGNVDR